MLFSCFFYMNYLYIHTKKEFCHLYHYLKFGCVLCIFSSVYLNKPVQLEGFNIR